MSTPRVLKQYFALIGLPAIVLGICAFKMLDGERGRMREVEGRAAHVAAAHASTSLRNKVAGVCGELLLEVERIQSTNRVAELRAMAEENPLVRNVFLYDSKAGLIWPDAGSATADEKTFMARYELLFSRQMEFDVSPGEEGATPAPGMGGRAVVSRRMPVKTDPRRSGWRPWFEGSQLYLLGWFTDDGGATYRGVEVETMALVSRFGNVFEELEAGGDVIVVVDGNGQVAYGHERDVAVQAEVSLSPELPHWVLKVWRGGNSATGGGAGLLALGGLLLALLVAALFAGGALLVRDASRQRREAMLKTTFVSNVSHELKTPLTSIRMYAELLEDGRVGDPAKASKFLGTIVSESKRLSRLVNNMLDFSRLEQGRRKYAMENLDVCALVREVADSMRECLGARGLEVETELPEGSVFAEVDGDALSQVLVNLLDNAGKYAASGKVVSVAVSREGGKVEVSVADCGPGIDEGHAEKIFERFYRVDDSITAETAGCGLGLGIARLLMRGMGGDLTFAPGGGGGCRFTATLAEARELKESGEGDEQDSCG